jgi:hypothetical protein
LAVTADDMHTRFVLFVLIVQYGLVRLSVGSCSISSQQRGLSLFRERVGRYDPMLIELRLQFDRKLQEESFIGIFLQTNLD